MSTSRLQRIERKQEEAAERLAALEERTNDIHAWLSPKQGRPTLPERVTKLETRQAGLMKIVLVVFTACVGAVVAAAKCLIFKG